MIAAPLCYRLDRAQENLHFLIDICENFLYILETDDHEVGQANSTKMSHFRRKFLFVSLTNENYVYYKCKESDAEIFLSSGPVLIPLLSLISALFRLRPSVT